MEITDKKIRRFRYLGITTIAAVYCLILIAGAVCQQIINKYMQSVVMPILHSM